MQSSLARQMIVEAGISGEGTRERFALCGVEIEGVSVGGQVRTRKLPSATLLQTG